MVKSGGRKRRSGGRLWSWLTGRSKSYPEAFARGFSVGLVITGPVMAATIAFVLFSPPPGQSGATVAIQLTVITVGVWAFFGFLYCTLATTGVRTRRLAEDFPHLAAVTDGIRCSVGGWTDSLVLAPGDASLVGKLGSGGSFAIPWHLVRRPRVQQTQMGEAVLFGTPAGTIKVFPSIDASRLVERFEERMGPRS